MSKNKNPELLGRVTLSGEITAVTGLHIGGTEVGIGIGGVDKTVVRNPMNNQPYIPGSSLKGKLRSLLERALGAKQNSFSKGKHEASRMKQIKMHSCETEESYNLCPICQLFGVPSNWDDKNGAPYPTRLVVRDGVLVNVEELRARTELPFAEVKTEVSIDRLTSAANPRTFERVPAEARFRLEMVVNFYTPEDGGLLDLLLAGFGLLEGDYLGGQGSRGYGQVKFNKLLADVLPINGADLKLPKWIGALNGEVSLSELPWKESLKERSF